MVKIIIKISTTILKQKYITNIKIHKLNYKMKNTHLQHTHMHQVLRLMAQHYQNNLQSNNKCKLNAEAIKSKS